MQQVVKKSPYKDGKKTNKNLLHPVVIILELDSVYYKVFHAECQ